jgi:hypothetical protein
VTQLTDNVYAATLQDVIDVTKDSHPDDELEARILGYPNLEDGAIDTFNRSSVCFCWKIDGKVLAVFGVFTDSFVDVDVFPWVLITKEAKEHHALGIAKIGRVFFKYCSERYRTMRGIVNIEYETAQRWLAYLGFNIGEAREVAGHGIKIFQWGTS